MLKFRHLLAALIICSTLATVCALAQSSFTQIRDIVTNPDGTPFNGMVVITWNGYSAPSGTPVSQLSASARIYNGALSVLLVPTTTATAGTYYQVVYNSSDGTVTWSEAWQVPPSTTALTISQVRQSSTEGSGGGSSGSGSGQYATLPISISQVTDLSADLSSINTSVATLTSQVSSLGSTSLTALTNTVNGLSTTVGGLSTTVSGINTTVGGLSGTVTGLSTTVSGLSTTVTGNSTSLTNLTGSLNGLTATVTGHSSSIASLTGSLSSLTTTVSGNSSSISTLNSSVGTVNSTVSGLSTTVTGLTNTVAGLSSTVSNLTSGTVTANFVDGETPSGTINGTNAVFNLANTPLPTGSLSLFRNGLIQSPGVDFNLSGAVVTFLSVSIPQTGDVIRAFYRVAGSGPASTFVDAETPGGSINGTNLAFTLAFAPNPSASLKLYKNGLLMAQGGDFTLSGSTVTFVSAAVPLTGDTLLAAYRH